MSSVDLPDHMPPVSKVIIAGFSDPVVAIGKPFLMGLTEYKDEYDYVGIVKCEPALTEEKIKERLKDERFCKLCLMFEIHSNDCEKSPWNRKLF